MRILSLRTLRTCESGGGLCATFGDDEDEDEGDDDVASGRRRRTAFPGINLLPVCFHCIHSFGSVLYMIVDAFNVLVLYRSPVISN